MVKLLEDMLAEARAGRVVGVCAATFDYEQDSRTWQIGKYSQAAALWAFEHMKHRLLHGP